MLLARLGVHLYAVIVLLLAGVCAGGSDLGRGVAFASLAVGVRVQLEGEASLVVRCEVVAG